MARPKVKTKKKADAKPRQEIQVDIEDLTKDLANKPYGEERQKMTVTSLSISENLLDEVQLIAFENKRAKRDNRSASAVISEAVRFYIEQKRG